MKENSIEETIKIIKRKIKEAERYSDITGLCLTLDEELRNALMNILSDYKRVLKENEELKEGNVTLSDLYFDECIPKQIVKDKIEEIKERKMDIVTSPIHNRDEKIEILKKDKIRIQDIREILEGRK